MGNTLLIGIAAVIILFAFAGMIGIVFFSSGLAQGGATRPASGRITREDRPVSSFRGVSLAGMGRLEIVQADHFALAIEADDDLLPQIRSRVTDGRLLIDYDAGDDIPLQPTQPPVMTVHLPEIEAVALAGDAHMLAETLQSRDFALTMSGSGGATIGALRAESFAATLNGRVSLTVAGRCREQVLDASGVAQVDAAHFETITARVLISGMSQATVWAAGRLAIEMSGSGRLQYYGDPQVTEESSGSGVVLRLGAAPGA